MDHDPRRWGHRGTVVLRPLGPAPTPSSGENMKRPRTIAAATVVLLASSLLTTGVLTPGAPAWAAPTWTDQMPLSAPGSISRAPNVHIGPDGSTTTVFLSGDASGRFGLVTNHHASGGQWGGPNALSPADASVDAFGSTMDPNGVLTVVWSQGVAGSYTLMSAQRRPGSGWSAPVQVSPATDRQVVDVAGDATGAVTVLSRSRASGPESLATSTRSADGTWGASVAMPYSPSGEQRQIAMHAGRVVAVWKDGTGVALAASLEPGGTWSSPATISPAGQNTDQIQLAIADTGLATAVWRQGDGSIMVNSRTADGGWQYPIAVGTGNYPGLTVAPSGDTSLVWVNGGGTSKRIHFSQRRVGLPWTDPETIGGVRPWLSEPRISTNDQGALAVAWLSDFSTGPVEAAWRPVGGGWQNVATLSDQGSRPTVQISPAGDVVTAWDEMGLGNLAKARVLDVSGPRVSQVTSSAVAGQSTKFSATVSDDWSPVTGTTWDFGDGTAATAATPSKTFPQPGTYTITLRASDVYGNATSAEQVVTVTEAAQLGALRLKPGKLSLSGRKGKKKVLASFTSNTAGSVRITLHKPAKGKGKKKSKKHNVSLGTRTISAGTTTFTLKPVVKKSKKGKKKIRLRKGRYTITVVLTSASGSSTTQAKLRVVR